MTHYGNLRVEDTYDGLPESAIFFSYAEKDGYALFFTDERFEDMLEPVGYVVKNIGGEWCFTSSDEDVGWTLKDLQGLINVMKDINSGIVETEVIVMEEDE